MTKLIVFGIDSATWDLIDPWIKANKLPGFKQYLQHATRSRLNSTMPPYTASAWPTMFTGQSPAQHGVYDFRTVMDNDIRITDTTHLNERYIWHQASKASRKVCIFNIPMTYPPHPVNGILVSSFTAPSLQSQFTYPSVIKKELLDKFPDYRLVSEKRFIHQDLSNNIAYSQELIKSTQRKLDVARYLLNYDNWDLYIANILEIDHAQHFFWPYHPDTHPDLKDTVLSAYQLADAFLSDIIKRYSATHAIMLVSDHGAGSAKDTFYPNIWLEKHGYLRYKKTPTSIVKRTLRGTLLRPELLTSLAHRLRLEDTVKKANQDNQNRVVRNIFLDIKDVDFLRSKAYSFGEYGGIFLNHKILDSAAREQVSQQIIWKIRKDFPDRISHIDTSEAIYGTSDYPNSIPDIQFLVDDGATTCTSVYAFAGHRLFTSPISHKTGNHRRHGILALSHPQKKVQLSADTPIHHTYEIIGNILGLATSAKATTRHIII